MSILVALTATPALLGTQEAIRQSQQKERREEHRARRCNLIAKCIRSSVRCAEIDGRPLVLRDGEIFVDTASSDGTSSGHQYAGYYLPYPDKTYEGLVTTVTEVAPIMNWVYVDAQTYQLKYGIRKDAEPNITGQFDCTRQNHRLTLLGWEGFCAVEARPGTWAVYFDLDDDGLKGKVPVGTRVLEIELERREKRWKKEATARAGDQTTMREQTLTPESPEIFKDPASTRVYGPSGPR
ncbi:hypothetical protein K505DRAFT_346865 [Melanomma pulvis-pyrius CBS 109.77]|uniref:Uncharacterized protein n=1 Tax=Melanomma pulvis-pyrius CBS 109.77 TaxID=1314802 RepID=A0A6A6XPD6_9PLEO|nr:hypothetical protein K505DRAFT_346865 [Melanomma pulvis-pyrius CBS 109.77]